MDTIDHIFALIYSSPWPGYWSLPTRVELKPSIMSALTGRSSRSTPCYYVIEPSVVRLRLQSARASRGERMMSYQETFGQPKLDLSLCGQLQNPLGCILICTESHPCFEQRNTPAEHAKVDLGVVAPWGSCHASGQLVMLVSTTASGKDI